MVFNRYSNQQLLFKNPQDLEDCANTLIGDEVVGMKGVSGGQKRRVSLAIDLVKVRVAHAYMKVEQ